MTFPGPAPLGRGAVMAPDDPVPAPLRGSPEVRVDLATLEDPAPTADRLHRLWASRTPVVVRLHVDPGELLRRPRTTLPPWRLGADHEFPLERLAHLVWANTYDLRSGTPVWWHAVKARRAGLEPGGARDARTPDGREVWVDGGPRGTVDLDEPVVHRESTESGRVPAEAGETSPADLAPDQRAAVFHPAGPARIIAPAGSGKTRVLTERLRHLLATGVEPDLITAVAYNTRAAAELRERVGDTGTNIRTIHSLGLSILNRAGPVTVVEEREVRRMLEPHVPVRPQRNQDVMAPYVEALQEIRIGLRDPDEIEAERDDVPGLAGVYAAYHDHLHARGLVDFDEQVHGAIELLLADPEARDAARSRARHLLVDEFQDLTPAYLLLLRLVALPSLQVFGVGDDDQVIYGYAGADPGYLIDFERRFPGAAEYALEVNYRCSPAVVEAAGTLLANSDRRIDKAVRAAPGRTPRDSDLQVVEAEVDGAGAAAARLVTDWLGEGIDPDEIAVLARVNDALLPVHAALVESGAPFRTTLGPGLVDRTGVRAALSYLRIALDPDEILRGDLFETLKRPSRRISRANQAELRRRGRWRLDDLDEFAADLDGRDAKRLPDYVADLARLAAVAADGTSADILAAIRDEVGLGSTMTLLDGSRSTADRSSHVDDLDALVETALLHPDAHDFEPWLRRILEAGGDDGVTLSSIHRVKGREWRRVVVFRADHGLMPHRLSNDVEEERRVFHVALTRGAERVAVVSGTRPSPFVDEMQGREPRHPLRPAPTPATATTKKLDLPTVGSTVTWSGHTGIVEEADGKGLVLRLETEATLRVPPGADVTVLAEAPVDAATEALFEALRSWRQETAAGQGVPAYVVFHDKHLHGIARAKPTDLATLARCEGVGPTKLERYGDDVLRVVEETMSA